MKNKINFQEYKSLTHSLTYSFAHLLTHLLKMTSNTTINPSNENGGFTMVINRGRGGRRYPPSRNSDMTRRYKQSQSKLYEKLSGKYQKLSSA